MEPKATLPAHDPESLALALENRTQEPQLFRKFLRQYPSSAIDARVKELSAQIAPQIQCLDCAQCCKKLEPELRKEEVQRIAQHKNMSPEAFIQAYLTPIQQGEGYYFHRKPCIFLSDTACTIYEDRPGTCSGYPHLDHAGFRFRLNLHAHYRLCPIVFSVTEHLMKDLGYIPENSRHEQNKALD